MSMMKTIVSAVIAGLAALGAFLLLTIVKTEPIPSLSLFLMGWISAVSYYTVWDYITVKGEK